MHTPSAVTVPASRSASSAWPIYFVEAMGSTGGTLFTIGIFFYTRDQFGWTLLHNFLLTATQALVYVVGALLANVVVTRVPHARAATALHGLMAALCLVGVVAGLNRSPAAVTSVLLAYTFVSAVTWPILESWVVKGVGGAEMARRIGAYNIVWPAVGAVALAGSGSIIQAFPVGVFLGPAIAHVLAVLVALLWGMSRDRQGADTTGAATGRESHASSHPLPDGRGSLPFASPSPPVAPEPELLRVRTVALWVSRLGLPATYAVIYGLMPLMQELPTIKRFDTATQTVVSSTWLASRWLVFVALAYVTWWHTRPRVMVVAAVFMLVAFLGVTLAPSQFLPGVSASVDLAAILVWQIVLGAALGVIYSGSLYFGMVLSDGSTEHSGYHEALIGVGWLLGPAAGAIMQYLYPGDVRAGVIAVGSVIAASVVAVIVAGARRG